MKHSFLIIGLFAFICVFTSCSEDNFDTTTTDVEQKDVKQSTSQNNIMTRASSNSDESTDLVFECLSLKYPFELVDVNGNIIVVDNDAQYESVVFDTIVIDFNYPLSLIDSDGETVEAEDANEFAELFAACIPFEMWDNERFPVYLIDNTNECYALVFPLSVQNESGENLDIENRDDFLDAITKEVLFFNFPFSIVTTAGDEFSINSIDDYFDAIIDCNGFSTGTDSLDLDWESGFDSFGCYKLEFPLNIIDVDGNTLTVDDQGQMFELVVEGKVLDFEYPLQLTGEDGEEVTANSQEELNNLLLGCFDINELFNYEVSTLLQGTALVRTNKCYDIIYPISVYQVDSEGKTESMQVASDEELQVFETGTYNLEYPIDIKYYDGRGFTINQFEDMSQVTGECFDVVVPNGADARTLIGGLDDCYDLVFPIEALVFDTMHWVETGDFQRLETYNSPEELRENVNTIIYVEFPFKVVYKSDGREEEITDLDGLGVMLEVCG